MNDVERDRYKVRISELEAQNSRIMLALGIIENALYEALKCNAQSDDERQEATNALDLIENFLLKEQADGKS